MNLELLIERVLLSRFSLALETGRNVERHRRNLVEFYASIGMFE